MYKGNNSVNWASWSIATNSLGGIFVPLYDNQNDDYVNHIIKDCNPKVFVTNDNHHKSVDLLKDTIENKEYHNVIPVEDKSNIAKLIYTSGTTGKPKELCLVIKIFCIIFKILKKHFMICKKKRNILV